MQVRLAFVQESLFAFPIGQPAFLVGQLALLVGQLAFLCAEAFLYKVPLY